jgi:hypothetical protein
MEIISLGIGKRVKIGGIYTVEGKRWQVVSIPCDDQIFLILWSNPDTISDALSYALG